MPTIPAVPGTYRAVPPRKSRGLMISAATAAVIVLGALLYLVISNTQSASPPVDTPYPTVAATPPQAAAPVASPAIMAGTGTAPNTGDPTTLPPPVGRWMDKEFDYYEFDDSGSGSRGNVANGKPVQTFNYTVERKELILSLHGSSTQSISFSYGPGSGSLYLRQPNGHYTEYTRQG